MNHETSKKSGSKTVGRAEGCDIALDDASVSRQHALLQLSTEGYLSVHDQDSSNGTFVHRNGQWIRIRKVSLGSRDRIRFGEREVELDRLVEVFGSHRRIRLREETAARGDPLITSQLLADLPRPKTVLEHPRRNPLTGKIEEAG
jgi:pSer/pThr/pTyr-binding forkhead associated (FHA) protein